ncbi:MAG TPA: ERF family protein [Candidatus Saccharimonadales bacterium]|nr:ERF family protein [Candidatus Saccharimonadales bacterium]
MKTSPETDKLLPALMKARAAISILPLVKDAKGERAKYLKLGTLLAAVEPVLFEHDIMIVQGVGAPIQDGLLIAIDVQTTLLHVSGQWISTGVLIPVAGPMLKGGENRGAVSAPDGGISISYGRRYGLMAILSITPEDDNDGVIATSARRGRARAVAVGVAERATNSRTESLKQRLAETGQRKLVKIEQCMDCGAKQGQPHEEGCPNA